MSDDARITLRTIADRAGVSVATVSTVLSNKAGSSKVRISDQTIQKVRRTARSAGYRRQVVIGLIPARLSEANEIPVAQSIIQTLREEHDVHLALGVPTQANPQSELIELALIGRSGFDGAIMEPSFALLRQLADRPDIIASCTNLVFINRYPVEEVPCVTVDHRQCGVIAARHLIDNGHARIAFLADHGDSDPASCCPAIECEVQQNRYQGFSEALAEAGRTGELVHEVEDVLARRGEFTAIYCAHTRGSTALLSACWQAGVSVPAALSIVGQDDEFTKEIARPALTTVDVRTPEVGQLAARTIIARIDGEKPKSTVLAPRLIERESVRHL